MMFSMQARSMSKAKEEAESAILDLSREVEGSTNEREACLMSEVNTLRQELDEANLRLESQHETLWARKRPAMETAVPRAAPRARTPRRDAVEEAPRAPASARKSVPKDKAPAKTPGRGGATPKKGVLRPSSLVNAGEASNTNRSLNSSSVGLTLDEKLERLRVKKREAAEMAGFENGYSSAAKRPVTAPSRPVATRLGSGAARVAKGAPQKEVAGVAGPAGGASAKRNKTGGWR